MRLHFAPKKFIVTIIALVVLTLESVAGDTLIIPSTFYHIDHTNHLILINQSISNIALDANEPATALMLDKRYAFVDPVTTLSSATSYQVSYKDVAYTLYFTQLPIIHIGTDNEIVDSPSVYAQFSMCETNGLITESAVGIETRGGFSQSFPKKSYELSFWSDNTGEESRDVHFLQMRTDNKWNLQAMYNEPLRLRNKVSNELWQNIHQIYYKDKEPDAKNGIDMAYVELFVNKQYKGLYALSERIDRKQLKLKKYSNGIKGELYKGGSWEEAVLFTGLPAFNNASLNWGGFEYKHPEEETDWSNLYSFVSFVTTSTDQDFNRDYKKWFSLDNAVDYYIFLNLLRAGDNYGKNLYIAKYKTDDPYYYVPWDLDGVFGTDWLGQNVNVTNDILSNGFYRRMMQDRSATGFRAALAKRWAELRSTIITEDFILSKFSNNYEYLINNNVYEREHIAWSAYTHNDAQFTYISNWLKNRLEYLDVAFGKDLLLSDVVLSNTSAQKEISLHLYPNPASGYLNIASDVMSFELIIQDMNGKVVLQSSLSGKSNTVAIHHLKKGLYVATIKSDKIFKNQKLLIN